MCAATLDLVPAVLDWSPLDCVAVLSAGPKKKRKKKEHEIPKKKKEMMKWTHPFRVPDTAGRSMFRNQPLISKSALSVDSDLFRGRSGEKQNKTKQKKQKTITKIKSKSNGGTVNPFFQRNRIIIFFRRL